jgi:hypothetical protein
MAKPETDPELQIADLKRELRFKDERINELKLELEEQRALVHEMEEHVKERDEYLENFIQTFGLVLDDDGTWTNGEEIKEDLARRGRHIDLIDRYNKLVRSFNRNIASVNPVGRPVAASEPQQALIIKHHKAGKSLRWIAEELTLSLQTVRTVIGKTNGTDRTTDMRRLKLGLEPKIKDWRVASRDRLPKAATKHFEKGRKLLQEAKGLRQRSP